MNCHNVDRKPKLVQATIDNSKPACCMAKASVQHKCFTCNTQCCCKYTHHATTFFLAATCGMCPLCILLKSFARFLFVFPKHKCPAAVRPISQFVNQHTPLRLLSTNLHCIVMLFSVSFSCVFFSLSIDI